MLERSAWVHNMSKAQAAEADLHCLLMALTLYVYAKILQERDATTSLEV